MTRPAVDMEKALRYLAESRDSVAAALAGLSEEQCRCKPDEESWSMGECVEHLAIIENIFLQNIATQLLDASAPADDFDAEKMDGVVLAVATGRDNKIKAPDRVCPKSVCTAAESLARLQSGREQTIAFFRPATGLREHSLPHPLFGPLDAYQWALLLASHTERHARQMHEVKQSLG